ncbi:hypothetical protein K2173_013141 [Erythroxylum novogranatense]|uniref:Uncharacterized protein n=1 Tax=Erythroxylum novogranatense TaxID=1862640 RepID=A0AAV8S6M2_9ROSI|nr:hypothetical protein K2173_013141 [Erythroxylum novogranatense]
MECCRRPNRSDIHLSVEEEAKIEVETREHFDEIAPKRHTKPQRSEYSANYVDVFPSSNANALGNSNNPIPEYLEFQRLQNDPFEKLNSNGSEETEEFVETEYYKDLNSIDKQHHTTGTGFIKTENANGKCFSLTPDTVTDSHASCKGNPATNDWIPAPTDMPTFASDKPNRSES